MYFMLSRLVLQSIMKMSEVITYLINSNNVSQWLFSASPLF